MVSTRMTYEEVEQIKELLDALPFLEVPGEGHPFGDKPKEKMLRMITTMQPKWSIVAINILSSIGLIEVMITHIGKGEKSEAAETYGHAMQLLIEVIRIAELASQMEELDPATKS